MRRTPVTPGARAVVAGLLAALLVVTVGRAIAAVPVPASRPMYFEHLTMRDGLSQGTVMSMLQDSQGYLWLATESGLDRYDGYTVREYRRQRGNEHALANDYIWAIAEDTHGDLWLATDGGGVERWDPHSDEFQQYRHDPANPGSLASDATRALLIDADGRIWAGTQDRGVDVIDPKSGVARHFGHLDGDATTLSSDAVFSLYADHAGQIWVGTDAGLCRYDARADRFVTVGGSGPGTSLSDVHVRAIREDRSGVLWIGTAGGGASHWNPGSWALGHYRAAAFRDTTVNAFADDGASTVWVGTGAGLVEIDARTGRETVYRSGADSRLKLGDDRVMALLHDSRGALWVGTMAGGLDRFDLARGSVRSFRHAAENPDSLPADGVMALYQDRRGIVWVGAFGGGLASIDPLTDRVTRYPVGASSTSLSSGRASAIAEDGLGNLWIGTAGGGLNLLDPATGRFHHYRRSDRDPTSLNDDTVYALHVDRHGQIWIGTAGGGLDRVVGTSASPEQIRFENQSGLARMPSQVVWGIESDETDALWLSTNNGLVRFDPQTRATKVFHEAHGLQGEEFTFNAHYRGHDGALYFGGNNGFNAFLPGLSAPTAPAPRVVLTAAAKLNDAVGPKELLDRSRCALS